MKHLIIIFCLILISCTENKQEEKKLVDIKNCKNGISIEGYGIVHTFFNNPDTVKLNSNSYLVLKLFSCSGDMELNEYNIDNSLAVKGNYQGGNELVKGLAENVNPYDGSSTFDTTYNYYPKRIGTWESYDKDGKVIKSESY